MDRVFEKRAGLIAGTLALIILMVLVHPPSAAAASCIPSGLYGSNGGLGNPSNLYRINPATGGSTLVGTIGFESVGSLDFHPGNGNLYGTGRRPGLGERVLITINPCTGAGTEVGPLINAATGGGASFDISFRNSDATLFLDSLIPRTCPVALFTVNLVTGEATTVGSTNTCDPGNGMGFSSGDTLFHANTSGILSSLNQITGAATPVASLSYVGVPSDVRLNAMEFHPVSGVPYVSLNTAGQALGPSYLGVLDTSTGVVTDVGLTVNGLDGLAWAKVPQSIGGTTSFSSGPGSSSGRIAILAGVLGAVVAIGGWYARRRWLRS